MSIVITGGSGMVGQAFKGMAKDVVFLSSADYDLTNEEQTMAMYDLYQPDYVIHLAAKVGGIVANTTYLADFYTENMKINTNILHGAYTHNVTKVVSLLSTCVYPDKASYPLTEEQIHNGSPHKSNYAYAYAKRMLDIQSQAYHDQYGCNFVTAVPNNLYGEHDNFHLKDSHVIPAMIRKMYEAKETQTDVVLWGDGSPLREFTYSPDLAQILLFVLENYDKREPINVGNTKEISIQNVANMIASILEYEGRLIWDVNQPKGQFRKPSDNKKLIEMGWDLNNYTPMLQGLKNTCDWFITNYPNVRGL